VEQQHETSKMNLNSLSVEKKKSGRPFSPSAVSASKKIVDCNTHSNEIHDNDNTILSFEKKKRGRPFSASKEIVDCNTHSNEIHDNDNSILSVEKKKRGRPFSASKEIVDCNTLSNEIHDNDNSILSVEKKKRGRPFSASKKIVDCKTLINQIHDNDNSIIIHDDDYKYENSQGDYNNSISMQDEVINNYNSASPSQYCPLPSPTTSNLDDKDQCPDNFTPNKRRAFIVDRNKRQFLSLFGSMDPRLAKNANDEESNKIVTRESRISNDLLNEKICQEDLSRKETVSLLSSWFPSREADIQKLVGYLNPVSD
jgi:hypothetical protein